jgi:hypothetical protein
MRLPSFLLLLSLTASLHAQVTPRPYSLPRVGSHIATEAVEYFQLFPDFKGSASFFFGIGDSVHIVRTAVEDTEPPKMTISHSAATVLGIYLAHFEKILTTMSPFELRSSDFLPDSLRGALSELFDQSILPKTWKGDIGSEEIPRICISLKNGEQLQGQVLGLTNMRLLVWTASSQYNPDSLDTALRVISNNDIESLTLREKENTTGVFAGIFGYLMVMGQSLIGSSNEMSRSEGKEASTIILLSLSAPLLGVVGSIFSVPHTSRLNFSDDEMEQFQDSPLYQATMSNPGIPPEIIERLTLNANEKLYTSPKDSIPYVSITSHFYHLDETSFSIGLEQMWLWTNDYIGLRPGITADYTWASSCSKDSFAELGIRTQLSMGAVYASGGVQAVARLGSAQLVFGARGVMLPEELAVNTRVESRYQSTYTTIHKTDKLNQSLFTELGIDYIIWRSTFGVHWLWQLSPSVTETVKSRDLVLPTETITQERGGLDRLMAIMFLIQFHL